MGAHNLVFHGAVQQIKKSIKTRLDRSYKDKVSAQRQSVTDDHMLVPEVNNEEERTSMCPSKAV